MTLFGAWPPTAHLTVIAGFGAMAVLHHRAPERIFLLEQIDAGADATVEAGPTLDTPEARDYAALLADLADRPLFSIDRAEDAADAAPVEPAAIPDVAPTRSVADPSTELRLLASILHPSGSRALVVARGRSEPLWVGEGDSVAGWTITAITQRSIVMRTEAEASERTVKMLE
ncbi:hypothetical protein CLV79_102403 [Limimaricola soesokkakensis]|uniref:Uncharacterized protein n=1 Tax=Limimaricola soesokkakensis TaxID=1343159 RepID=A0A1X6YZC2_9RHOB|nr:hypothetical protein [Limimaricola soesokkakensis]PSK87911.1 hypothetical protein CLV79_102403 [Limimaricola soesokkakensis]SLN36190.1 hypothetical protein LOS8367_01485 [Limimaricola soesokkakensis]